MTTQRERFEAWAKSEGVGVPVEKDSLGYFDVRTIFAYAAWQEAERQMKERCAALCEQKAAHAALRGGAQNCANMARMLADDIRALGDDDAST